MNVMGMETEIDLPFGAGNMYLQTCKSAHVMEHPCFTFVIDPPLSKTASERRKLPAGIAKFGILDWLCHVKDLSLQVGLLHVVVTTTSVSTDFASTKGPSDLQE